MATNNTSSSNLRAEKMGDVLDALSSGIAKTAANVKPPRNLDPVGSREFQPSESLHEEIQIQ